MNRTQHNRLEHLERQMEVARSLIDAPPSALGIPRAVVQARYLDWRRKQIAKQNLESNPVTEQIESVIRRSVAKSLRANASLSADYPETFELWTKQR